MKTTLTPPPLYKTMPDGEHRLCRSCFEKGYGVDSYHPVTGEFWPVRRGQLALGRCMACKAEAEVKRKGMRRGVVPDDFVLPPRTAPYGQRCERDIRVHAMTCP